MAKKYNLPRSVKKVIDKFDAWDKKHLTPPGKRVKSQGFKMGKAYILPKSTGDAKAWIDYQSNPKKYEIRRKRK